VDDQDVGRIELLPRGRADLDQEGVVAAGNAGGDMAAVVEDALGLQEPGGGGKFQRELRDRRGLRVLLAGDIGDAHDAPWARGGRMGMDMPLSSHEWGGMRSGANNRLTTVTIRLL